MEFGSQRAGLCPAFRSFHIPAGDGRREHDADRERCNPHDGLHYSAFFPDRIRGYLAMVRWYEEQIPGLFG